MRPAPRRAPMRVRGLLVLALLIPGAVTGQQVPSDTPQPVATEEIDPLASELVEAQRTHLRRVLVWGGANLLLGAGLIAAGRDGHPTRHAFGVQTAAWGAINLGIVAWANLSGFETAGTAAELLAAENGWSDILLVNLGLNVGYMMVGGALHVASGRGLRSGDSVRGHADAVIVQGLGLLVLDGLAWASSRGRLGRLHELAAEGLTVAGSAWDPAAVEIAFRLPIG